MEQLSGLDASFLYLETHTTPMNIGGIYLFDPGERPFDFEAYRTFLGKRLALIRTFRERLVHVPLGLGRPYWIDDPDFDLDLHLHHVALPRPGGWSELMERNRSLALRGRQLLCAALRVDAPAPEEMLGSLASVALPDSSQAAPPPRGVFWHPLQRVLLEKHAIEVPVMAFPAPPRQLIRISAQIYNHEAQYARLAGVLVAAAEGGLATTSEPKTEPAG